MISIFRDNDLDVIPPLYSGEELGDRAICHIMIKIPYTGFVWLLTEYSPEEQIFFGFACLNDVQNAELGYISKQELEGLGKQYPLVIEKLGNITLADAKAKYIPDEDV